MKIEFKTASVNIVSIPYGECFSENSTLWLVIWNPEGVTNTPRDRVLCVDMLTGRTVWKPATQMVHHRKAIITVE